MAKAYTYWLLLTPDLSLGLKTATSMSFSSEKVLPGLKPIHSTDAVFPRLKAGVIIKPMRRVIGHFSNPRLQSGDYYTTQFLGFSPIKAFTLKNLCAEYQ